MKSFTAVVIKAPLSDLTAIICNLPWEA